MEHITIDYERDGINALRDKVNEIIDVVTAPSNEAITEPVVAESEPEVAT